MAQLFGQCPCITPSQQRTTRAFNEAAGACWALRTAYAMSPFLECQARRSLDSCGQQTSPSRPSNGAFAFSAAPLSPRYTAGPENVPKLKWRKGVCARVPYHACVNCHRRTEVWRARVPTRAGLC